MRWGYWRSLLFAVGFVAALPWVAVASDDKPWNLDLAIGKLNPDTASQGTGFTALSFGETRKEPEVRARRRKKSRGENQFYEVTSDYLYRGGNAFSPGDYVVAIVGSYNYYVAPRVVLSAGMGANYSAFRGEKRVAGLTRCFGVSVRIVDKEEVTLEGRLRWCKYAAPGDALSGLVPSVRLRWTPER